jgi:hypothetical protein
MKHFLKNLWLLSLLAGLSAVAPAASVQGVLMDKMCSYKAETRITAGDRLEGGMLTAYVHTRQCALMPDCEKSGYGVFTYDNKFLVFDAGGNRKVLALLKETKKEDDLRVEVVGEIQGGTIKVTSIKLL